MTSEPVESSDKGAVTPGGSRWVAFELAAACPVKLLVTNPVFRAGVVGLGRDQELLSEAERLAALLLLVQLEKTGKDGRQLAGLVLRQVIAKPPSSLRGLRSDKEQLLLVQSMGARSVYWVADYLATEIWRAGISKKVISAAAETLWRKSDTWADGVNAIVNNGERLVSMGDGGATASGLEAIVEGVLKSIESSSTSPGQGFFLRLENLLDTWRRVASCGSEAQESGTLFIKLIRLIRIAVASRPLLLQQSGLAALFEGVRRVSPSARWSLSAEVELKGLRALLADRIAIDAENGAANLELFRALEVLFVSPSDALKMTGKLAALIPTAAPYLLTWMQSGVLELPPDGPTYANDDRRLAALYVRADAIREALDEGMGINEVAGIRAICIEIEQMAKMHGLALVWKRGDMMEYMPLRHRYREPGTRGSTRIRIEVPAVEKCDDDRTGAEVVLPAWVCEA